MRGADNFIDLAIAEIERNAAIDRARTARIEADPRIIRLKAMRPERAGSAIGLFTNLADGSTGRRARIGALIRARIAQLDFTGASGHRTSSPHAVKQLRQAATIRRQHWNTVTVSPELVALEFVTEPSVRPAETGKDTNQIGRAA